MSYKPVAAVGLAVVLLATGASTASAQGRSRGRAVPRGSVRMVRPPVLSPRGYYARPYVPRVNLGFFYGRPGFFGSYVYGRPYWDYGYRAYGYPSYGYGYAPYGYGYGGYSGQPYGGVRIDLPQRDAEVYVDGYFVGTVDDFDGVLQQANLEAGPHGIEVREQGYEPITFEVNVEPGRTITYRGALRPFQP